MAVTTFPLSANDSTDLNVLSLTRLLHRLQHNLLSPGADLKPLRGSEYQRMRVGANIAYAQTTLTNLERTLPNIKALDRRHDLQTDLTQKRQLLKHLQHALDEITAEVEISRSSGVADDENDDDEDSLDESEEDLLGIITPSSTSDEGRGNPTPTVTSEFSSGDEPLTTTTVTETATATPTPTVTTQPQPHTQPTSPPILRNRAHAPTSPPSIAAAAATSTATTTGTSTHPPDPTTTPNATESTLSANRTQQEDLTTSLLSLATQLKTSSQAFQSSLESEKSILNRAVDGLDRTTGNMATAEKRMGMLRRMTEGKGWWGRMMLYAWIFGLWLVAVLIVFLGPKLRF